MSLRNPSPSFTDIIDKKVILIHQTNRRTIKIELKNYKYGDVYGLVYFLLMEVDNVVKRRNNNGIRHILPTKWNLYP